MEGKSVITIFCLCFSSLCRQYREINLLIIDSMCALCPRGTLRAKWKGRWKSQESNEGATGGGSSSGTQACYMSIFDGNNRPMLQRRKQGLGLHLTVQGLWLLQIQRQAKLQRRSPRTGTREALIRLQSESKPSLMIVLLPRPATCQVGT